LNRGPSVFLLQETHFTAKDSVIIDSMLKLNRIDSYGTNRQKGTTIVYNADYFDNICEQFSDDNGRVCVLVGEINEQTIIIVNVYAPNDHSLQFFERLMMLIENYKDKYPNSVDNGWRL